ncbi:aspartate/glutamate racemase family protein [Litoribacter ruber]|uniref:glutamate racemase n=1 Tax=Litoribacter ruber TaxID=702568 RepID=UPI001BDB69BD|nr:aspartate/glutamate racemase family protein [Litoribacter ruber]MBT0810283.1 aspartate/glutamate racemase family protein [Litoribacter ruber]
MISTKQINTLLLGIAAGLSLQSCQQQEAGHAQAELLPIERAIIEDQDSFFHVDFENYPHKDRKLPIGVFDSGTGGLTILNSLLDFDEHDNMSRKSGSDQVPDFSNEKFIYLADQANMPYGNYYAENKSDLLIEHIIKDAQFLLSDKYYPSQNASEYRRDKQPVKAMVIACNTATAYGKENIEAFIDKSGVPLKVIGVIDAGAKGALSHFEQDEDGAIAVFATVGTIASKGYENTILKKMEEMGFTGDIQVYNQGGHGIAEAVDEEPDYINRDLDSPREDYRGPSLDHEDFKIDQTLMDVYNFDFDHNKMLCDVQSGGDCEVLQINSSDNYVRYHLVSMMEKIRKAENPKPLKVVMLGCTHYPYLTQEIEQVLEELRNYQQNGEYVYRKHMADNIAIVDPAINVAEELYAFLDEQDLFNLDGDMQESEFYISVPNTDNPNVKVDDKGRFPYDFKYGRTAGEVQEYVKRVPFSNSNIPSETLGRLEKSVPTTYQIITEFNKNSDKTSELAKEERIQ